MATPIIYFGKNKEISDVIINGLKPDYDVVQFFSSTEEGKSGLASAISGKGVKAVVFGKGFKNEEVEELKGTASDANVLWLTGGLEQADFDKYKTGGKPDEAKATPSLEKYGPLAAKKIKGLLDESKPFGKAETKSW